MASHVDISYNRTATKTVWILLAIALSALEFFVPRIPLLPWLKPGFANVITILWIVEFGAVDALLFSLLRTWIVGFFFGFSFFTMTLALSGGILSVLSMSILWEILGKRRLIGTVGIGICGALFHNIGQLSALFLLMDTNTTLLYQIPFMCVASVVFGGITGLIAPKLHAVLSNCEIHYSKPISSAAASMLSASKTNVLFSLLLAAGCAALVFVNNAAILALCATGTTIIVQIEQKGSWPAFIKPLSSFWLLFGFIAVVNIMFSYGMVVAHIPWLTQKSIDLTVLQWLRLWTWLQVSSLFSYFNFNGVLFSMLKRLFTHYQSTLYAGILALEFVPALTDNTRKWGHAALRRLLSKPVGTIQSITHVRADFFMRKIEKLYKIVAETNAENPSSSDL